MECPNVPDSYMTCVKKNGQNYWVLGDKEEHNDSCPENSTPWRVDALCNVTEETKCYETEFKGNSVAVCVVPTEGKTELEACGQHYLESPHMIENDVPITDLKYFEDKVVCTKQNIGQLQGAELVTWVQKGREDICQDIVDEATDRCEGKANCDYKVEKMYSDENMLSFDCVLDTKNVPANNQNTHWWNWLRINKYDCKDKGWTCTDDSLSEYKGGEVCQMKDDCHKNAEFGICKNKKCALGPATGSNCGRDEDCDRLSSVEGTCKDGRCSTGKNGLHVEYIKPKNCSINDKKHPYSLHQYCGKVEQDGSTIYTGVCTQIEGSELHACKAFESTAEIKEVKNEEENYLRGIRYPQNFYDELPPWDNLDLCPREERIEVDGKVICAATTERLEVNMGTVQAKNMGSADIKCKNRNVGLPLVALPSF